MRGNGEGLTCAIADLRGVKNPRNTPASGRALLHGELTEQVIPGRVAGVYWPDFLVDGAGGSPGRIPRMIRADPRCGS